MLDKAKTTNFMTATPYVLCCLLLAAVLTLMPSTAGAQCTNWDASGESTIYQRGQKPITLTLQQNGRVITGEAKYDVPGSRGLFTDSFGWTLEQMGSR
jgi:hypothetical protein